MIEVFVKPGDAVKPEDPLLTLESDKATMDVPAPGARHRREVRIKVGDKVSEGCVMLVLDAAARRRWKPATEGSAAARSRRATRRRPKAIRWPPQRAPRGEKGHADSPGEGATTTPPAGATVEVRVPDIGGFSDVPVIEVFVKPGDVVKPDDPLITLESDKATMDVPSPARRHRAGRARRRRRQGERRHGDPRRCPAAAGRAPQRGARRCRAGTRRLPPQRRRHAAPTAPAPAAPAAAPAPAPAVDDAAFRAAHASPSVRRFARELGVDLGKVAGTGPKARITQEDVQAFVKGALAAPASGRGGAGVPSRRRHAQPAAVAAGRLREVGRGRGEAAVAHQEDLRRQPRAATG